MVEEESAGRAEERGEGVGREEGIKEVSSSSIRLRVEVGSEGDLSTYSRCAC